MVFAVKAVNAVRVNPRINGLATRWKLSACFRSQHTGGKSSATGDGNNFISVTADPEFDGSVAIVQMQKKRGNSLCGDFAKQLTKAVHDVEQNEKFRAMIITSSLPGLFGAGMDFAAVVDKTPDEVYDLWMSVQDMVIKLYGSRLITVAAINGHCVAGLCPVAFSADYRVMADGNYTIGLNEAKLGMFVPVFLLRMVQNLLGYQEGAKAVQLGTLFNSAEACKRGLVDEVVPSDQVLTAARDQVKRWLEVPDSGRISIKMDIRKKEIEDILDRKEKDAQFTAKLATSPHIQANFKKALEGLMKKKKK